MTSRQEQLSTTDHPTPKEPVRIGEIIDALGGPEEILTADLPAGRTPEDQRVASIAVDIDELAGVRRSIIRAIREGNDSPEAMQVRESARKAHASAHMDMIQASGHSYGNQD